MYTFFKTVNFFFKTRNTHERIFCSKILHAAIKYGLKFIHFKNCCRTIAKATPVVTKTFIRIKLCEN